MAVHFVTGKLGGGKTLVSVGRIQDYLKAGKRVATNLDINLEKMLPTGWSKPVEMFRIPDKPKSEDLFAIGRGTESKKDEDFGLVVLDELGTWLNSRSYQKDQDRQGVIDWFLHARKYGWDVFLIVQDPDLIDKQVRISLGEHVVICRRTDRIPLPIISTVVKLLCGYRLKLPRMHVGNVFYGSASSGIKVDTWCYRGNHLFNCYDTNQVFLESPNRIASYLPPSYLNCIPIAKRCKEFYLRLTKIYFKRFKVPLVFLAGLLVNTLLVFGLSFLGGSNAIAIQDESTNRGDSPSPGSQPSGPIVEKETSLVKLSTIALSSAGQVQEYLFIFDGKMFNKNDFPHPVEWHAGTPYAVVAVVPKEEKNSIF